jgi:Protein of unknown function (DUF1302)
MFRTRRPRLAWVAGGVLLLAAHGARAIYLDEDQNITLRARIYSQGSVRIDDSQVDTEPTTKSGQLIQNRNFFNPELDAKLNPYLTWLKGTWFDWLSPDDFRFRVAGWGFYDGIYDYGSAQFNNSQKKINASFNNAVPRQPPGCIPGQDQGCNVRQGGWFAIGPNIKLPNRATGAATFDQVFPGFELYEPRSIYANRARVNELYLSYTKGPFFLRVGKQSISWGESDTIALLDQSNPFDLTLAAPGFFEDIDEARIPLYTIRTSYNLFETLGPLSSGFVEGYWVPGDWDATTPTVPLLTASPYSPRGVDPQLLSQMAGGVFPPTYQFVFFDHIPKQDMDSSRWGVRFQTVINRFLTAQAWVYRTFPTAPVPVKLGYESPNLPPAVMIGPPNQQTTFFVISLEHKPVMVYGLAGTFFLEALDGIVRVNAQLFEHEAGFIPQTNLNICSPNSFTFKQCPGGRNQLTSAGHIPYQDILRYEVGFDRFFFLRWLNPTNSFLVVASAVGAYNASKTGNPENDFRFNGQLKPGPVIRCFSRDPETGECTRKSSGPVARGLFQDDYVNQNALDAQFQTTFQTDYMHGRLTPRVTFIQFVRGTFAVHPSLTYRWSDYLLFQADLQIIEGAYQSLGFFRDRDQVSFRVTYQLN